ncbi:MAG: cytochrome P450 [Polyangiales bacterium]
MNAPTHVPGVPLLGSSLAFAADPVRALPEAARAHGEVFAMRAFGRAFVVVAGEAAVRCLQGGPPAGLERRSFYAPFARELGLREFVLGAEGEAHARLRQATRTVYAREVLAPHLPRVAAVVRARAAAAPARFALAPQVARWCLAGYGPALGRVDTRAWEDDVLTFSRTALALGVNLLPEAARDLPAYRRARARLRAVGAALVDAERRAEDGEPTIARALLRVFGEGRDDDAVGYLLFSALAVTQYVSRTVAWMLAHAAADPALGATLAQELRENLHPASLDPAALTRLAHLRALYRECLRRYPVQAALPYVAREDVVVAGRTVPRGTLVLFAGATGHFDPAVHPDPWRVDPARFRHASRCGAAGFVPFGYGDRACTAAGQTELLALTVAASALSVLDLRAAKVPAAVLDPLPGPAPWHAVTVAARRDIVATVDPLRWAAARVGADAAESEAVRGLLAAARPVGVAAGEVVVREGDAADAFYVLREGRVRVERGGRVLCALGPGDFFGEMGLLLGGVRTATVVAESSLSLLAVPGETFRALVAEGDLVTAEIARLARRRSTQDSLRRALPRVDAARLAAHLTELTVVPLAPGEAAVRQGDAADAWYVVGRGSMEVWRDDGAGPRRVGTLDAGEAFGEIGLLQSSPRTATVRAGGDGAEVLRVPAAAFHAMMAASPESRGDVVASMLARIEAQAARALREGGEGNSDAGD